MEIFFELLDDKGDVHDKFKFYFDNSKTSDDLQRKIKSKWSIEIEDQQLFIKNEENEEEELDGRRDQSLNSFRLKNGSVVYVKHANLSNFVEMRVYAEEARRAKNAGNKEVLSSSVASALPHLKVLDSTGFFTTYTTFGPDLRSFRRDFAAYLDTNTYMKDAFKVYFSKLVGDSAENPSLEVTCEKKLRGRIQNHKMIATVKNGDASLGRYYVKVHMGLAVGPCNGRPDLREVFAYQLLSLISLGPKCHFVPNSHFSELGLFICTEEVPGFKQSGEVELSDELILKKELIERILVLRDLHSDNYGVDESGRLQIVDFYVGRQYGKIDKFWREGNKKARRRIARESLKDWNLQSNITASDEAIAHLKSLLREKAILYTPSSDYNKYLEEIRNNIDSIANSL